MRVTKTLWIIMIIFIPHKESVNSFRHQNRVRKTIVPTSAFATNHLTSHGMKNGRTLTTLIQLKSRQFTMEFFKPLLFFTYPHQLFPSIMIQTDSGQDLTDAFRKTKDRKWLDWDRSNGGGWNSTHHLSRRHGHTCSCFNTVSVMWYLHATQKLDRILRTKRFVAASGTHSSKTTGILRKMAICKILMRGLDLLSAAPAWKPPRLYGWQGKPANNKPTISTDRQIFRMTLCDMILPTIISVSSWTCLKASAMGALTSQASFVLMPASSKPKVATPKPQQSSNIDEKCDHCTTECCTTFDCSSTANVKRCSSRMQTASKIVTEMVSCSNDPKPVILALMLLG